MLLGFHKVNTTAYYLQADGLVERYNCTLTAMLVKTTQDSGCDWDKRLPLVLFTYRACCRGSTHESSFFLVCGRDLRLPTPAVLNPKKTRATMDLREYGINLHSRMSTAWELAWQNITRAQRRFMIKESASKVSRGRASLPIQVSREDRICKEAGEALPWTI